MSRLLSSVRGPAAILRFLALSATVAAAFLASAASAQGSASPYTSGSRYDQDRRVTGTIAPDPGTGSPTFAAVRNSYDPAGRLVRVEKGYLTAWQSEAVAPASWTGFIISQTVAAAYDSMGRKLLEVESSGGTVYSVTQTSYDSMGRVSCIAVRMNPALYPTAAATGGSLPPSACTLGAEGSQGRDRITRTLYHLNGQPETVQKAYGTALQQNYASYSYSANGKATSLTDANGNRAEMSYDGLDRLSRWTFPAPGAPGQANAADYEQYGYDAADNRVSLRKRDGVTIGYSFDALNRVEQKIVPASASGAAGYSVFYGYDLRGLQTYARFGSASGEGVTNGYDGLGRIASSTSTMGGVARTFNSQYDAGSNRIVLSSPSNYYAAFAYDGLDRISAYKEGATTVVGFDYDPAGRRSALRFAAGATSTAGYGYDGVGRLNAITRELAGTAADQVLGFTHNPASQIATRSSSNDAYASNTAYNVSRPYSVNGLNQYTAAGPASFAYDANGNLTSDGSTSFVYDSENRLVSASGAKTASLGYDPLGRLWQTSGPSGITRFIYDGYKLVEEYDGYGNRPRVYVHGPGADEPLVLYEWTGGPVHRFYHSDHQGSIVALADDYGNALAINGYDPWGIPNAGNQGRFQYTGQAWIAELGMYYYKARIYSPTLGRFLQTDPIGYDDQVNLYAYVGNDPLNRTDPTGREERKRPDGRRVILVYPQSSYEHLQKKHWPTGSAESRYDWTVTKPQAEKIAGDTVVGAIEAGTHGTENGYYNVYESLQAPFGGYLNAIGMKGEDYNRVVTTSPAMLTDPKMKAEVAAELARPEFQATIAEAQRKSPGLVEIEVVMSQYPQTDEQLKYKTNPK